MDNLPPTTPFLDINSTDAYFGDEQRHSYNHPLAGLVTASILLLVVLLFFFYEKCCFKYPSVVVVENQTMTAQELPLYVDYAHSNYMAGLDKMTIDSLPIFTYEIQTPIVKDIDEELGIVSTRIHDEIQCAVCLCEFEEGEKGRMLPRCKHSFHTECIDMWFYCHSTCPLCRTLVTVESPSSILPPPSMLSSHTSSPLPPPPALLSSPSPTSSDTSAPPSSISPRE